MKIAMFTESYYPNFDGVAAVVMELSNKLAERGHKVAIFCPIIKNVQWKRKYHRHKNVEVHRFRAFSPPGYKTYRFSIPNYSRAKRTLEKFKPDVIHVHTPGTMGILGIVLGKKLNKKIIITYHTYIQDFLVCISPKNFLHINKLLEKMNIRKLKRKFNDYLSRKTIKKKNMFDIKEKIKKYYPHPMKRLIKWYSHRIHHRCDVITVPSMAMKRVLQEEKMRKRKVFISNGIDCKKFSPKKKYEFKKNIVHVGRISYEKNIEIVIMAFKKVMVKHPDAHLHIYGDGPALGYLKTLIKKEKIMNVTLYGFVPQDKLPEIYRANDIFVTASTIETQGLVILEAMSSGLPIVGVDKLAIPDLVKNDINGYVVKPCNAIDMSKALNKLLGNPANIEKFGKKSVKIAKEHDFSKIIKKYEALYKAYSS